MVKSWAKFAIGILFLSFGAISPFEVEARRVPDICLRTTAMLSHYSESDRKNVYYLNEKQTEEGRVQFKNGLALNSQGELLNQTSIFVMDSSGSVIILPDSISNQNLRHSSLLRGEAVALAGRITIENGKIKLISNLSGHYIPTPWALKQGLLALGKQGLDISTAEAQFRITEVKIDNFYAEMPVADFLKATAYENISSREIIERVYATTENQKLKESCAVNLAAAYESISAQGEQTMALAVKNKNEAVLNLLGQYAQSELFNVFEKKFSESKYAELKEVLIHLQKLNKSYKENLMTGAD
ncbi:MAG: hypothetical protein J0L93_04785 [Deltaproteobacteria bacterium]|nr:hypothetical protein [Deltaproteobacteria bacterium]